MRRDLLLRNFTGLAFAAIWELVLGPASLTPALVAQVSTEQYPPGRYPPGRPTPIAAQCQNALADRVSADAGRRVNLSLDSQNPYSSPNGRQGSSRESALWNCRSEHMEISDLRLRCGSSLESCGTRELQSAGQQQRLARRPWLSRRTRLSWCSRDSQLSQGESRYVGTGYLQQQIYRKCQHHPWLRRQQRGDSVSFTAGWKFQDYFLRSGGAVRWRRIHHASYRFRPWRCTRDRPSPAQPRS
jgi:hypothetical protein